MKSAAGMIDVIFVIVGFLVLYLLYSISGLSAVFTIRYPKRHKSKNDTHTHTHIYIYIYNDEVGNFIVANAFVLIGYGHYHHIPKDHLIFAMQSHINFHYKHNPIWWLFFNIGIRVPKMGKFIWQRVENVATFNEFGKALWHMIHLLDILHHQRSTRYLGTTHWLLYHWTMHDAWLR